MSKKDSPMPAGRELDALVCEKVFGYLVNRPDSGAEMRAFRIDGPVVRFEIHGMGGELTTQIPHYSTDIAAAWEVVEKLTTSTKQWFEYEQSSVSYFATFRISGAGENDGEWTGNGWSAAEAICRAALRCVTARHPTSETKGET